jgi:radical SAM superfamily enzyme YgiQ (UPF0313 family)
VKGFLPDKINGIAFNRNGAIITTPKAQFIENLDALPFPAYDLVNFSDYYHPGLKPTILMSSSRGCPYHCINCSKMIHGDSYRVRSPENVIEEIMLAVSKYHVKEIQFWDDNFTLNPCRVKKICELILQKNYHKKLRFSVPAGIRADIYDKEMFDLMKKAGFYILSVAVESGNQNIIDKIEKKLDLSKVPENIKKIKEHGFRIILYFMMGFPFETSSSMKKTVRFASSLPGNHIHFFSVTPFPGTKLFDIWNNERKKNLDYQRNMASYDANLSEIRSKEETRLLKKMTRRGYLLFYANPTRLLDTFLLLCKERTLLNDMSFLLSTLWKIATRGHR